MSFSSFFRTVKWFHLFLSNLNNSIYDQVFVCTHFNVFHLLLCIKNNSIDPHSFAYIELIDETVVAQTIQFSIITFFIVYTQLNLK